ncbi:hypothetical protein [Desulfovibrio sp. TomC]|uniref:hypothetical protein n=1 Tax=Desulfovibrio sp. TomC TaxID=1562888 RepID=UPI00069CC873|nr:hypothetical protein [Desulfovibrio sp. TomC]
MKRTVFVLVLLAFTATAGWAMDLHEGFDGKKWGGECSEYFSAPEWKIYHANPIWNKKNRTLTLSFDEANAAKSKFILKYYQTQKVKFEDFSLLNVYYGCSKDTNKLSLVVVRYSVPSSKAILAKLIERLGQPTTKNIAQTIWDLDDIYVQFEQSIIIFYWKQAGLPN